MSWSIGEIRSLALKAARGAGMEWGMAEEAGFALEWLERNALPGTKALAYYLSSYNASDESRHEYCPIMLGCRIADSNNWHLADKALVNQPLLITPFLASLAGDRVLQLAWLDTTIKLTESYAFPVSHGEFFTSQTTMRFTISIKKIRPNNLSKHEKSTRIPYTQSQPVKILSHLAHKTYAPATEASRIAGAGAGLNDND